MSEIIATFPLRKPITKHGGTGAEEITSLALKMPSGRIVMRLGEPFTTKIENDGAGGNRIEFKVIPSLATEYLVEMTGINADLLGQLHPLDVLALFDKLVGILRPIEG